MKAFLIIYLTCMAAFILLTDLSRYAAKKNSDKLIDTIYNGGKECLLLKKQFWGIAALSFPVIFYFTSNHITQKLLSITLDGYWICLWIIAMLLSIFISNKATASQLKNLKQQNRPVTKPLNVIAYFTGRIVFLFLYELFFRGVLLFSTIAIAGNVISIVINIALYTALHAYCTTKEIIATVPFGIVICLLSIASNSVWPAVLSHIIIAITTDWIIVFSIKKSYKLSIA
ncbi:MAG: CPBP family intramembrane glutamic endopeptidase [Ferruginibacter sp.]